MSVISVSDKNFSLTPKTDTDTDEKEVLWER